MIPGTPVRVLEPFAEAFPGTYLIGSTEGTTAFLEGIPEGFPAAFDFCHLEAIP